MVDALEVIAARARDHKEKFPAFDLDRFLDWVAEKSESWTKWAQHRPITQLNKSFRSMRKIERLATAKD